jgi:Transposase DDE domain
VRRLGRDRAGEMRITRFLRNRAVTVEEMVATAAERTLARAAGRHVLAIQDTTTARVGPDSRGAALHPTIAVDAVDGSLLGLVHAEFLALAGGLSGTHKARAFGDKQSARWLRAAERAAGLGEAGAVAVTVVADRDGDIYEEFACRPAGVEVLVRAAQDRLLADGAKLFATADRLAEAGRMTVDLAAAPGRAARTATLALRFGTVEVARPRQRQPGERARLPASLRLTLVDAREIDPPAGAPAAHWRLLTTHRVADVADARRIVGFYRARWTIEQLFRILKTKGFDIEALRVAEPEPFEKLVAAALVAAVTVLQLVRERDGEARRPLEDSFDPDDRPVLERLSASLEGKTERQKNPHPEGSLAFAAWVFARLGGWTGYYGKPGPIVIFNGLVRYHAIKHGWTLRPAGDEL